MQISIVQIGNSKGIRLSKTLLEKYQISDKLELLQEDDHMILKPVVNSRDGWEASFAEMHKNGDDKLLIDSFFEDENLD